MRVFGNVSIGIHGKELPKFADSPDANKEYWKLRGNKSYVAEPHVKSRIELLESQKYWAKPDQMRISDGRPSPAPVDPFKTAYVPQKRRNEVCTKINQINAFILPEQKRERRAPRGGRWTTSVERFMRKERGTYEQDPATRASLVKHEMDPLYSSFNPDQVFVDPRTRSGNNNGLSYGLGLRRV